MSLFLNSTVYWITNISSPSELHSAIEITKYRIRDGQLIVNNGHLVNNQKISVKYQTFLCVRQYFECFACLPYLILKQKYKAYSIIIHFTDEEVQAQ